MQFSKEEWNIIVNSNDTYFSFYYYWTAKEAAIKANGKGFSLPLENISTKDNKAIIEQSAWHIKRIDLHNNYMVQIASNKLIESEIELFEISF
jgi:4'-phosphopantetheinyl transferase